jgi:hypothetical protein
MGSLCDKEKLNPITELESYEVLNVFFQIIYI